MIFNYLPPPIEIPQGSWCAILTAGNEEIDIEAGKAVPCFPNFFVSGVWDGDFKDGDFSNSNFPCCTGAKLINENGQSYVKFSTPTHMLESIYLIPKGDKLFLSNSLPFVLERARANLSTYYLDYQRDMCSSLFGIDNQIESSPLADGVRIYYHRCCDLVISKDLKIKKINRDSGLSFSSYDDYIDKVRTILNKIKENATDNLRPVKYGMITTISRGYDAPATSALVKEIGCDTAFTFNKPEHYASDCGTEIAKVLGYYEIIEGDADKYLERENLDEAEDIVTGDLGPGLLGGYKECFRDKLMFLGTRGDSIWEKNHANVNNKLDFTVGNTLQQNSHSYSEMCFDINSVCIHLPMIGADRWKEISEISKSKEMAEFSMNNGYDRPIARRIVEEKGVARDCFGQKKSGMGVSYHFYNLKRILKRMSPAAAFSLKCFKKSFRYNHLEMLKLKKRFYMNELPFYLNYIMARTHVPIRFKEEEKYISSPQSVILLHWSVDVIRKRYRKPLIE